MTNQTKIQMLVALLLVWGGTVLFQYLDDAENTSTSSSNVPSSMEFSSTAPGSLILAKTFPNPRQSTTLSTPRNIFSPFNLYPRKQASPQKAPTPKKKNVQSAVQHKMLAPAGPSPIELATQRAQQLLQQFRFLGYIKKSGESQAFLTKGQSIYIVKQGATVEGRILVNRIDPTTIILSTQILESGDYIKAEIPLTKDAQRS